MSVLRSDNDIPINDAWGIQLAEKNALSSDVAGVNSLLRVGPAYIS